MIFFYLILGTFLCLFSMLGLFFVLERYADHFSMAFHRARGSRKKTTVLPTQTPDTPTESDLLLQLSDLGPSPELSQEQRDSAISDFLILFEQYMRANLLRTTRDAIDVLTDLVRVARFVMGTDVEDRAEQAKVQEVFPELQELWVCADNFLDLQEPYYRVVRENIGVRGVRYYYLQRSEDRFYELLRRLEADVGKRVRSHVFCVLVGPEYFVTDWVIYNPERPNATGRINVVRDGQTELLTLMDRKKLSDMTREIIVPIREYVQEQRSLVVDCRRLPQRKTD